MKGQHHLTRRDFIGAIAKLAAANMVVYVVGQASGVASVKLLAGAKLCPNTPPNCPSPKHLFCCPDPLPNGHWVCAAQNPC